MDAIPAVLMSSFERAPWGWGLFAVVFGSLIKVWPIINAQLIAVKDRIEDRRERQRIEAFNGKREDLDDCKTRLDAMDVRLNKSEERAHQFELKLVGTLTAYRIIEAETESERPNSPALKQARRVLEGVFRVAGDVPTDMTMQVERHVQ